MEQSGADRVLIGVTSIDELDQRIAAGLGGDVLHRRGAGDDLRPDPPALRADAGVADEIRNG